jgi:hypothetical protein
MKIKLIPIPILMTEFCCMEMSPYRTVKEPRYARKFWHVVAANASNTGIM